MRNNYDTMAGKDLGFISVILTGALQVLLIIFTMTIGYSLLSLIFRVENLLFHYSVSAILGLFLGFSCVLINRKKFHSRGKVLLSDGVSSGLFGIMAILYASWLISPMGWPVRTVFTGAVNPGHPMNAWISAFLFYMFLNTPFIYFYLSDKEEKNDW